MYSECASLTESIQDHVLPRIVLHSYPPTVGKEVVHSILNPLVDRLKLREGSVCPEDEEATIQDDMPLQTREEVEWTMEVVGYGLQLPLTDTNLALVISCIDVYEDWLTAFSTPSRSVPTPIITYPDYYAQIIFNHFYQLFIPQEVSTTRFSLSSGAPSHDPQFTVCQRILTITQSLLLQPDRKLSEETCEAISRHLLTVCDTLLTSPLQYFTTLATRLSSQLIHVLFVAWLRTCTVFFPAPHMWKSLRELCLGWRHHLCLSEQWSLLMYSLTIHVVHLLYSPSYLNHLQGHLQEDADFSTLLESIKPDSLVQCWFRMLHTLGNPVELSYVTTFSSLPSFQKMVTDSGEHLSASVLDLPHIFHEAMQGLARLVYLFLGLEQQQQDDLHSSSEGSGSTTLLLPSVRPSPLGLRRKNSREKSSVSSSNIGIQQKPPTWYAKLPPLFSSSSLPPLTPLIGHHSTDKKTPRGNTLLHLFGSWLFEAASWPLHVKCSESGKQDSKRSAVFHSMVDLNSSLNSTLTTPLDDHTQFEAGRAEAFGALCAIFSSQPCGEPFLNVYLGWFYQCLSLGLQHNEYSEGHMVSRILLGSPALFRKGLPGINLLLPHFLAALEHILPHPTPQVRCAVGTRELRHAAIQILLSVLSLPLHFLHQPLPVMPDGSRHVSGEGLRKGVSEINDEEEGGGTYYSLLEWMLWLLYSAIEYEKDTENIQHVLHGMLLSLQDTVLYENAMAKLAEESTVARQKSELFSSIDKDYGSASLFRRACKAAHWCLRTWEGNIHISLAALELLQGLAQLQFEYIDHVDLKLAVVWICDYIQFRAKKDQVQHSKDLHTSIVASFSCLLSWVTLHPYLLGDKSTLSEVMNVVELGIAGVSSQLHTPSGQTVYKGDKELKPISGRVKDIAEFVLICIMEQVGAFPLPCGAETTSSLLNEEHLLARLPVGENKVAAQFKYFLLDDSTILGLLEAPFTSDVAPTVTGVVRGSSGRHCWNMQLRMRPCSGQVVSPQHQNMPRPLPSSPPRPSLSSLERRPWPEEACDGPGVELNNNIPSLDAVLNEDSNREQYKRMSELVAQQIELETKTSSDSPISPSHPPHLSHPHSFHPTQLEPPHRAIDTGRLLLNHLNLLGIETVQPTNRAQKPSMVMLDHTNPGFKQALIGLDRLSTRFCNTVFILYCKEGCNKPDDILTTQSHTSSRPPEFKEFIEGLGWMVDPLGHAGFAGKIRPERADETGHMLHFGAQIPTQPFPYYADSMTEMAFIQPIIRPFASHSSASLRSVESSDSGQDTVSMISKTSLPPALEKEPLCPQTSLPFLHQPAIVGSSGALEVGDKFHTLPTRTKQISSSRTDVHSTDAPRKKSAVPQDCAVMVVWLERYEDHTSFPLESLSSVLHGASFTGGGGGSRVVSQQRRILPCIFIHMLPSGLYQVTTTSPRVDSLDGPLLEGMVVSRRSLSRLVRLTAANMCGRHRLDNEGYCPPHVKRKRKIEEMAAIFSQPTTVSEFYSKLLLRDLH